MRFCLRCFLAVIVITFSCASYATQCTTTVGTKVYTFNTTFTSANNTVDALPERGSHLKELMQN